MKNEDYGASLKGSGVEGADVVATGASGTMSTVIARCEGCGYEYITRPDRTVSLACDCSLRDPDTPWSVVEMVTAEQLRRAVEAGWALNDDIIDLLRDSSSAAGITPSSLWEAVKRFQARAPENKGRTA